MNICFISPNPKTRDGIGAYSYKFAEYLSLNHLCNIFLISPKTGGRKGPFHYPLLSFIPSDFFESIRFIKNNRIDVIHVQYAIPTYGLLIVPILILLLYSKAALRTKIVITLHEVKRETDLLGIIAYVYFWILSKIADQLFVHTNEARKILQNKCHIIFSTIQVIPLFIFPKYLNADMNTRPIKGNVTFFGYIHVDKGIQYLIRAMKLLKDDKSLIGSRFNCQILGDIRPRKGFFKFFEKKDYEYKRRLIRLVSTLKLGKTIHFKGFVEEDNLNKLLNNSDIFVLPYTSVEQSGVLHRVLPFNRPIVASDIGGMAETLQGLGVLVPPKNSQQLYQQIKRLLTEDEYYKEIVRSYKQILESQSIASISNLTLYYYKILINQ